MEKYEAVTWYEKTHHTGLVLFLLKIKPNQTKQNKKNNNNDKKQIYTVKYVKKQTGIESLSSGL